MDVYQYILVLCLTWMLISVRTGVAIDCWVCTSGDTGCGETIDETTLQDNRKTESGCAACGKKFLSLGTSFYSIERTCLSSASDTCLNQLGYGECTCSTTFCNGQTRTVQSHALLTILCSVGILLQRLASW